MSLTELYLHTLIRLSLPFLFYYILSRFASRSISSALLSSASSLIYFSMSVLASLLFLFMCSHVRKCLHFSILWSQNGHIFKFLGIPCFAFACHLIISSGLHFSVIAFLKFQLLSKQYFLLYTFSIIFPFRYAYYCPPSF